MKRDLIRFGVIFALTAFFSVLSVFVAEMADVLNMRHKYLPVSFETRGEDLILSWAPLEYPCVYKVETLSKTTGLVSGSPEYFLLTSDEVSAPEYVVPRAPIPTFYRISARGIFTEIFRSDRITANPNFPAPPRPIPVFHYTKKNPASATPFLVWHTVPNAVCYELELLSAPPEIEGGTEPSKYHHLESTRKIFTNGCQVDLRKYSSPVYWRARALGLHWEPIGEFSIAEPIYVNASLPMPDAPLANDFDFISFKPQPIYPVYSWIPTFGAAKFQVELYDSSGEMLWSKITADQSSCYDDYARPYAGAYYWHVRALDENDNPVSAWSASEKLTVEDYTGGVTAAIFGDSISHGGGAVSYSPRSLEYSYATYVDFPIINLSRSGDISRTSLERFARDVLPFKPKNLIISTGANSLRDASITAESIIDDLAQLETLCRKNDIRPIFLTLMPINPANIKYAFRTETDPHWREKQQRVNDFIRQREFFIDIEPYFYDSAGEMDRKFSIDGIHPDLRGKMLIGEIINQHRNLFRSVAKK